MDLNEVILKALNDCAAAIRSNMESKNINASHRTEKSIRIEQDDDHIALVAGGQYTAPFQTLEVGRPAGNVPRGFVTLKDGRQDVSNTFKWILVQWAKDKGIVPDKGYWAFATNLGRRIAAEGTLRHKDNVDVFSTPVNETITKLRDSIQVAIAAEIDKVIKTNF